MHLVLGSDPLHSLLHAFGKPILFFGLSLSFSLGFLQLHLQEAGSFCPHPALCPPLHSTHCTMSYFCIALLPSWDFEMLKLMSCSSTHCKILHRIWAKQTSGAGHIASVIEHCLACRIPRNPGGEGVGGGREFLCLRFIAFVGSKQCSAIDGFETSPSSFALGVSKYRGSIQASTLLLHQNAFFAGTQDVQSPGWGEVTHLKHLPGSSMSQNTQLIFINSLSPLVLLA